MEVFCAALSYDILIALMNREAEACCAAIEYVIAGDLLCGRFWHWMLLVCRLSHTIHMTSKQMFQT